MHGDSVSATAPELREHSAIGVHLALFWGCPPSPPLPRGRRPLTYQRRRSPPLRAGLWAPRSPALKAQAHVGAGRLTRKRLPYRPPLRECSPTLPSGQSLDPWSDRAVRSTISGLESWPIQSFPGALEPAHPPCPAALALFEVGRPEGVHVNIRRSPGGGGGGLACNPELILEFT